MKILRSYPNRTEAEIAKGFLESEGISAYVNCDDEGGLLPALGAQMGATLEVHEDDFAEAEEVMQKVENSASS